MFKNDEGPGFDRGLLHFQIPERKQCQTDRLRLTTASSTGCAEPFTKGFGGGLSVHWLFAVDNDSVDALEILEG